MPTGVKLNWYSGSGSCTPWHSDNESLFGPRNRPKLIVIMSLGHSMVFQVRRGRYGVPSPIQLVHGDLLVMGGLAQSEYEHRTVSGLQGPRDNLTFRWVTQHIAWCPLASAMLCALPSCARFRRAGSPPACAMYCALLSCVQGSAEQGPLEGSTGIINGSAFWQWSSFSQSECLSWDTPCLIFGRNAATVVCVNPAWRCTSFRGVLFAGSGAGVGDCRGGAVFQNVVLFFNLGFSGRK